MEEQKKQSKLKTIGAWIWLIIAAIIVIIIIVCAVGLSKKTEERDIKLRYDGKTIMHTSEDNSSKSTGSSGGKLTSSSSFGGGYKGLQIAESVATNTAAEAAYDWAPSESVAYDDFYYDEEDYVESPSFDFDYDPYDQEIEVPKEKKIIYTYKYEAETTEFDALVDKMNTFLDGNGGYVENSDVRSSDYNNYAETETYTVRRAVYTLRIPAAEVATFRDMLTGDTENLLFENCDMEDKSSAYVDMAVKVQSLKYEYEALQNLMGMAATVSEVIEIEDRLTNLNYEIQRYEASLKQIDEDVQLSQVTFTLYEVIYFRDTVQSYRFEFGKRMAAAFEEFVWELPEFIMTMVYIIIGVLCVGLTILLVIVIGSAAFRRIRRKAGAKQVQLLVTQDKGFQFVMEQAGGKMEAGNMESVKAEDKKE